MTWVGAFCSGLGDVLIAASAVSKSPPTPQGQKDGLLAPRINDGKRIQDTTVGVYTTAAGTARSQREKLVALDVKDPDFAAKANQLAAPDLGAAGTQMQQLADNQELAPAFGAAPECRQLSGAAPR